MMLKREMKQTSLRKIFALLLCMVCCICLPGTHRAHAAEKQTKILPTDVTQASSGCVLVGIEGSYVTEVQAALDRVNEIRREACSQGVPDPSAPGRKLTMSDYVPIKWSAGLEYIARIRAAEAVVLTDHQRPNGTVCFSLEAPDGTSSFAEVLAWNSSSDSNMVRGIDQWYGEKADWVAQDSHAVTGHYTSMISPENKYMGLGAFVSEYGAWRCCVSGEFGFEDNSGSDAAEAVSHCIQTIEVKKSDVQELKVLLDGGEVSDTNLLASGKQAALSGKMKVVTEDGTAFCDCLDGISWTSSDASVAEVDASGIVTAKKAGNAVITAAAGNGMSASCKIRVGQAAVSKETSLTSLKGGKGKITVRWKRQKQADGYIIRISDQHGYTERYVSGNKSTKLVVDGLERKHTYYVSIQTYKETEGQYIRSELSKAKKVKTKA